MWVNGEWFNVPIKRYDEDKYYVAGFDALTTIGWTGIVFTALDEESGIFVDGTRRGGSVKKYADNRYYIEAFGEVEVGQVLTIKGMFRSASSENDLNVKEYSFVFNGSQWEESVATADVTASFSQIDYDYNTASNVVTLVLFL